jgi:transcriptional regulator with XRE-family HTH domain
MQTRLKYFRELRGLTQQQLGDQVGTSFQQIQRLETGTRKVSAEWAAKLAPALNVPWYLLFVPDGFSAPMPEDAQFVEDRNEIALLAFWRGLLEDQQDLILAMMRGMKTDLANRAA